jgi:aminoglycoside phosphotransferase (APT) family kinase protein
MTGAAFTTSAIHRVRVETTELERILRSRLEGQGEEMAILERRPFPYRSTFPLEEIVLGRTAGDRRSLVFKDLSRYGATDPVWRVKAPFLHDPLREIEVYRDVLAPNGVSAPECAATVIESERGRYWLFLEKVEGDLLWQVGDMEIWCRTAGWLARMHAQFAGSTKTLPRRLLVHDRDHYARWLERARRFVRWPELANGKAHGFDWLAQRYLRVTERVLDRPATFLHGEFYPSNIVIEGSGDRSRTRPVDWEMAGVGPGTLDLAALASGAWGETERHALAGAYREALPARQRPSLGALLEDLDGARLLLAVQWLGWSAGWNPPREHAHDWLATALELAETVR